MRDRTCRIALLLAMSVVCGTAQTAAPAAARKAMVGDLLIIAAYSGYLESELRDHKPLVVFVDNRNKAIAPAISAPGN